MQEIAGVSAGPQGSWPTKELAHKGVGPPSTFPFPSVLVVEGKSGPV